MGLQFGEMIEFWIVSCQYCFWLDFIQGQIIKVNELSRQTMDLIDLSLSRWPFESFPYHVWKFVY